MSTRSTILRLAAIAAVAVFLGGNGGVARAATAAPGERELPLDTSGRTFRAVLVGDEYFHYYRTVPQGIVVVKNHERQRFEVGELALTAAGERELIASGVAVAEIREFGGSIRLPRVPNLPQGVLRELAVEAMRKSTVPRRVRPPRGFQVQPLLTVIVEFSDYQHSTDFDVWRQRLYGFTEGTLNDYYSELTGGKQAFLPAKESSGLVDDGLVRVVLNEKKQDFISVGGQAAWEISEKILTAADEYVDFSTYDTDNSGEVEIDELAIIFIHSGNEFAAGFGTDAVWAHAEALPMPPALDGVHVGGVSGSYVVLGELHRTKDGDLYVTYPATLGLFAHELGHTVLGLLDLYHQNDIGIWGLMAGGEWAARSGERPGETPTHLCAYSKIRAGFAQPIVIDPEVQGQQIFVVQGKGLTLFDKWVPYNVYKILTDNEDQYFLVENRQNAGFDQGLQREMDFSEYDGGLAVFHINEALNEKDGRVDIESLGKKTLLGNVVYAEENGRELTSTTKPNSDLDGAKYTGIEVYEISDAGPIMSAFVRRGGQTSCRQFTDWVSTHVSEGRAIKLTWGTAAYYSVGGFDYLGSNASSIVTLREPELGIWELGECPGGTGSGGGWCYKLPDDEEICGQDGEPLPEGCCVLDGALACDVPECIDWDWCVDHPDDGEVCGFNGDPLPDGCCWIVDLTSCDPEVCS